MKAWYLIYSKPQQETLALDHLSRQGYQAYLPLMRIRKRHRGQRRHVVQPMFPRYLFVCLSDVDEDWGPIRSTIGVARMVRFGAVAAIVPMDLVETLRTREGEDGIHSRPVPNFKQGDTVLISEGPMAGYEAIFSASSGRERVILLLDMAGKSTKVQVPAEVIEPASRIW